MSALSVVAVSVWNVAVIANNGPSWRPLVAGAVVFVAFVGLLLHAARAEWRIANDGWAAAVAVPPVDIDATPVAGVARAAAPVPGGKERRGFVVRLRIRNRLAVEATYSASLSWVQGDGTPIAQPIPVQWSKHPVNTSAVQVAPSDTVQVDALLGIGKSGAAGVWKAGDSAYWMHIIREWDGQDRGSVLIDQEQCSGIGPEQCLRLRLDVRQQGNPAPQTSYFEVSVVGEGARQVPTLVPAGWPGFAGAAQ